MVVSAVTASFLLCNASVDARASVPDSTWSAENGMRTVPVPYGDFENWLVRKIKESAIFGGDTVDVYAVDDAGVKRGNSPYESVSSPWATSNVYADIGGIIKTNVNVRPLECSGGTCAELSTEMMSFKVMGMVKVDVLTAGAVYLGKMVEPVKGMDDPYGMIDMGIPFTERPSAVVFDFSSEIRNSGTISMISGMKKKEYEGRDRAIVYVALQRRWEENGKIYASRVATGEMLVSESISWNRCRLPLVYGKYDSIGPESGPYADLHSIFCARRSDGKIVPVNEVAWASEEEEPTHMILYFASGSLDVFTGELGNRLLVDNVCLEY